MAVNQDISLKNNDLLFINGDFAIQESDQQHIADTINAFAGWWKEHPADGVGVFGYLNSSGKEQALRRSVQINLRSDNYKSSPTVSVDAAGILTINANIQ